MGASSACCKYFARNRVNKLGIVTRSGIAPKSSDPEVIALGISAKAFGFDSGELIIHCLHNQRQSCGLFTRTAGKIAAMTFMQCVNYISHHPIAQIKFHVLIPPTGYQ